MNRKLPNDMSGCMEKLNLMYNCIGILHVFTHVQICVFLINIHLFNFYL